ncbi:MAG: dihydroneopterin aldolase [Acidimicrobiales bacterium]
MSDPSGDPSGDCIELRGLRVLAFCGVPEEERARAQPLEIDLDLGLDLTDAARDDDLDRTVDYGALCDAVSACVTDRPAALLEHLAQRVAEVALGLDVRVRWVTVAVRKMRPPVPHDVATAGVRVTRRP